MLDLDKLKAIVDSVDINLTEEDVINFLKNRKRWPFRYPWGQASVEILSNRGDLQSRHIFNLDTYLNFNEWFKFYNLGFTTVISNVLDLDRGKRPGNFDSFKDLTKLTQFFNCIHFSGGYPVEPIDIHPSTRHLYCL